MKCLGHEWPRSLSHFGPNCDAKSFRRDVACKRLGDSRSGKAPDDFLLPFSKVRVGVVFDDGSGDKWRKTGAKTAVCVRSASFEGEAEFGGFFSCLIGKVHK